MHQNNSTSPLTKANAEEIAIRILNFLASDTDRLAAFMNQTGMEPDDIAQNASSSSFLAGLLEHLLRDEALLLTFCGNENIDPALITPAYQALGGAEFY